MLFDFVLAYWHLFAMLVVVVFLLALNPGAGSKKVSPLQLPQLQNREAAVVLDVCEPEAFKQGHIEQAINLPLGQIKDKIAKLNKHKSKPIIVACQNGSQSAKAVAILRRLEFDQLYILEGGLAAWRKENLPLVKG
ncbi:MAG: rhodanese-like domain-containing protein [Gammaproteobacteria bacterium]|nr:rhodanese-like domain-containing protein [Gammaproteobacteria bacterium]MDD9883791.1 rhodanese-like domain-containing protein [Gammaproteobacteria bacterium]